MLRCMFQELSPLQGIHILPFTTTARYIATKTDLTQFIHWLNQKECFWDDDNDNIKDEAYKPLRRSSAWTPSPNKDPALEMYIKTINNDIQEQIQRAKKFHHDNLTKEEK